MKQSETPLISTLFVHLKKKNTSHLKKILLVYTSDSGIKCFMIQDNVNVIDVCVELKPPSAIMSVMEGSNKNT